MMKQDKMQALENQLCFSVYSMAHAFNRTYRTLLEPLDITYPQYLVMLVLWAEDGLSVKNIGTKLFLDSGTLTPLLKRLESQGLIRRVRDKEDERQVRISLTTEGRALQVQAKNIPHQLGCALGLAEAEYQTLLRQLTDLGGRLRGFDQTNETTT